MNILTRTSLIPPALRPTRSFPIILLMALLAVALFQGRRGLYESTEGRYAECARQTMYTNDWDDPVLNGAEHWTKPPLTYLAIMTGIELFGPNTWGARAYLIPCFVLTVACVYWIGRLTWDPPRARLAALVFATSPLTMGASNIVSTDFLLTMFVSLAMTFYWCYRKRERLGWLVLMWTSWGLAFLTKGPPALLLLAGVILAELFFQAGWRERLKFFHPLGLLAFAVVGLGWYAAESYEHAGLLHYWLTDEVISRNVSDKFRRNGEFYKGFVIYLPVLALGSGPWLFYACLPALRKGFRGRVARLRARCVSERQMFWLLSTLGVSLAVFMLSRSKLPLYILPLWVPIALLLGDRLHALCVGGLLSTRTITVSALALWACFILAKGLMPAVESRKDMKQLAGRVEQAVAVADRENLFLIGASPLNGLQYYLGQPVPQLREKDLSQLLSRDDLKDKTLYFLSRGDRRHKLELPRGHHRFSVTQLNRFWELTVVIPQSRPAGNASKDSANSAVHSASVQRADGAGGRSIANVTHQL